MEVLEKLEKVMSEFEKQKETLLKEVKESFCDMFKPIFEKSEKIKSFGWRQYTPYFNDGDTCEFGVYQDDLTINGEYCDDLEWYSWKYKYPEYRKDLDMSVIDVKEMALIEEIKTLLNKIPEDFYKDLFGDHVEVTVYPDRIEKEEYEHD